jgi:hypothetical protein
VGAGEVEQVQPTGNDNTALTTESRRWSIIHDFDRE